MKRFYIGNDKQRAKFLDLKYSFEHFKLDRNSKNLITRICNDILKYGEPTILISEGIMGYYTYYATGLIDNGTSIVINPIFYTKKGELVAPSSDIIHKGISKNIVILHKDLPFLKNTINLLESNGSTYEIVDNTTNSVVSDIIGRYIKTIKKKSKLWSKY